MKKANIRLLLFLSISLIVISLFILYRLFSKQDSYTFEACVLTERNNSSLLVYKKDTHSTDRLCYINTKDASVTGIDGKSVTADSIEPGQIIQVTGGGAVLAVAPPIYHTIYHIYILNEKNNALYDEGKKASSKFSI